MIVLVIFILSFALSGCQTEVVSDVPNLSQPVDIRTETAVAPVNNSHPSSQTNHTTIEKQATSSETVCRQWEQKILATTLRIQMQSSVEFDLGMGREPIFHEAISHATVVNGRYLVTHNHFKFSPEYQGNGTSLYATLYTTANEMIAEVATFTVAYADTQTLILEFSDKEEQGLFDKLGLPSAQMMAWDALPLEPGLEVAQVNWDGTTTQINCVQIKAVIMDEGLPRLDLTSSIELGSSGGGVFWQGVHIANNWQRTTHYESGNTHVLHQFSSAALNSSQAVFIGEYTVSDLPVLLEN